MTTPECTIKIELTHLSCTIKSERALRSRTIKLGPAPWSWIFVSELSDPRTLEFDPSSISMAKYQSARIRQLLCDDPSLQCKLNFDGSPPKRESLTLFLHHSELSPHAETLQLHAHGQNRPASVHINTPKRGLCDVSKAHAGLAGLCKSDFD